MSINKAAYLELRSEFLNVHPKAKPRDMNLAVTFSTGKTGINEFTGHPFKEIAGFDWCERLGLTISSTAYREVQE